MFCFFFSSVLSIQTKMCFGADKTPVKKGNPYTEWVSNVPSINLHEETPISISEKPAVTVTLNLSDVASYLVNNGFATQNTANKIQRKLNFSSKISNRYNDFACQDMSKDFFGLQNDQKNLNNFWNKIITRDAVIVKGTKNGTSVTLNLKRVSGQIKKRWAKVNYKVLGHTYWCTVTDEDCGMKTTQKYQCKTVTKSEYQCTGFGKSRNCGFKPVQKQECGYKPVSEYRCDKKTSQKMYTDFYRLYNIGFTDSWNKTEIEDMFNSVENTIQPKLNI